MSVGVCKSVSASAAATEAATEAPPGAGSVQVDARFLEGLLGYNSRRATRVMMGHFFNVVAPLGLKPVEFSVLSLIHHNPGITSRQLCDVLTVLPPNLVGIIHPLQQRGLIDRQPHPSDRRAFGLHLSRQGQSLIAMAEHKVLEQEATTTSRLTADELHTLICLLQKIYLDNPAQAPAASINPVPDAD